jgi:translation initiation factor IF-1
MDKVPLDAKRTRRPEVRVMVSSINRIMLRVSLSENEWNVCFIPSKLRKKKIQLYRRNGQKKDGRMVV